MREAGAIAHSLFGNVDVLGDHGDGNVFTSGDVSVNEHICKRITETFPEHDILSEESGRKGGDATRQWILDHVLPGQL